MWDEYAGLLFCIHIAVHIFLQKYVLLSSSAFYDTSLFGPFCTAI